MKSGMQILCLVFSICLSQTAAGHLWEPGMWGGWVCLNGFAEAPWVWSRARAFHHTPLTQPQQPFPPVLQPGLRSVLRYTNTSSSLSTCPPQPLKQQQRYLIRITSGSPRYISYCSLSVEPDQLSINPSSAPPQALALG